MYVCWTDQYTASEPLLHYWLATRLSFPIELCKQTGRLSQSTNESFTAFHPRICQRVSVAATRLTQRVHRLWVREQWTFPAHQAMKTDSNLLLSSTNGCKQGGKSERGGEVGIVSSSPVKEGSRKAAALRLRVAVRL